jgi:hypothetical protein
MLSAALNTRKDKECWQKTCMARKFQCCRARKGMFDISRCKGAHQGVRKVRRRIGQGSGCCQIQPGCPGNDNRLTQCRCCPLVRQLQCHSAT